VNHLETGCIVPAMQSLFVGILSGSVATGLAFWMDLSEPWALGVICGCCAALWLFISGINLWRLDVFSVPYAAPEPVEATVQQITPLVVHLDKQIQMVDLPASPAQLRDLSTGLLAGMSFSEASWSGEGRIFSRDDFRKLRDVWLQKGWCSWANPKSKNQGISLTPQGAAVCRHLAKSE
jgi:hypothetical protein